jgi:hypothetical protein
MYTFDFAWPGEAEYERIGEAGKLNVKPFSEDGSFKSAKDFNP